MVESSTKQIKVGKEISNKTLKQTYDFFPAIVRIKRTHNNAQFYRDFFSRSVWLYNSLGKYPHFTEIILVKILRIYIHTHIYAYM